MNPDFLHRIQYTFDEEGEYVVYVAFNHALGFHVCTRWLIPGTHLEG